MIFSFLSFHNLSIVFFSKTVKKEKSAVFPGKPENTAETIIGTYTIGGVTKNLTGIEVSYLPSFTAWEPQGYLYENGVVWITKKEKKTPASPTLYTIQNGTDHENKTVDAWYKPSSGILTIPLFSTEGISEITGTSTVKLRLNATVTEETATAVTITLADGMIYSHTGDIRYLNIGVSVE